MRRRTLAACLGLANAAWAAAGERDADSFWHQWRGPAATGVAPKADPPTEWGPDKNVRWKVELPGEGNNTPIIWGDHIFLEIAVKSDRKDQDTGVGGEEKTPDSKPSGADQPAEGASSPAEFGDKSVVRLIRQDRPPGDGGRPEGSRGDRRRGGRREQSKPTSYYQWSVLALERKTGKKAWERMVREEVPHEGCHPDGSMASTSAITDGERVYAWFGSRGLYALDMNGRPLWEQDFGDMRARNSFGEGGSPALLGDILVITWDHEGDSFIVALDKRSGKELWRKSRDERTSWATPLILAHDGAAQVIASATNRVRSYDLKTGDLLWECGGMTANVIPSPVSDFGMVYAMSGFRGAALKAIRYAGAQGDITGSDKIAWTYDQDTPYVPSPLLYQDTLYFLDNNRAVLTCLNARTGEPFYGKQRVEEVQGVYASPIGAAGRVYIAGRDGKTVVIERGPEYKVLATNVLEDGFDASPVAAGHELYLRGQKYLYCIARD